MAVVLQSRLLRERGVVHAFSTREGGVSVGPFASLNVAVGPGDEATAVAENLRRFCAVLGVPHVYQTSQVHGSELQLVRAGDDPRALLQREADALTACSPGIAVGVRVADCVPVLVHDVFTGEVAAIHAGWRGVAGGVVSAAIAHLALRPASAVGLVAAIGPCIGVEAFEVGEEVVEAIELAAPAAGVVRRDLGPKPHVDLRRAVRAQLRALGLSDEAIEDVPGCTFSEPTRFFSFRRDGARSGRLLAAIVRPAAPGSAP